MRLSSPLNLGKAVYLAFFGFMLWLPGLASATCGSEFCTLNNDWITGGVAADPSWRLDVRYEYLNQNRLQKRTSTLDLTLDSPNALAYNQIEGKTISETLVFTLDHQINVNWGFSIALPYVTRHHQHFEQTDIDDGMGGMTRGFEPQAWDFSEFGDMRIVGRYQWGGATSDTGHARAYGLNFGVKVPTGNYNIANVDGDKPERNVQPGTGTTDGIVGAFVRQALGGAGALFAHVTYQSAFAEARNYAPGDKTNLDLGYRYAATSDLGLMLQINSLWKTHDRGDEADMDNSGSSHVFLSPGISYQLAHDLTAYSFYQLPLYQNVNGVQLVADYSYQVGVTARF